MGNQFQNINWVKRKQSIETLLEQDIPFDVVPLEAGLEAEVMKIHTADLILVLKVWNRESKPNVGIQYDILDILYKQSISVSEPLGWGIDANNNQLLLTTYDGSPIHKVDQSRIIQLANILISIHKLPLDIIGDSILPKYDFVDYFYLSVDDHPDIKELLLQLVESTDINQNCIIHGDYHLGNILEADGKYSVIDWTNVQLGEPRYDIAWSTILIWIYVSEKYGSIYRNVFLSESNYSVNELELFEAIATLRWILLNRISNLPKRNNTISRVKTILKKNKYLHEKLL